MKKNKSHPANRPEGWTPGPDYNGSGYGRPFLTPNEALVRSSIDKLVKSIYDLQAIRMESGARITTNLKFKLGLAKGKKDTSSLSAEDLNSLVEHARAAGGMVTQGCVDFLQSLYDEAAARQSKVKGNRVVKLTQKQTLEALQKRMKADFKELVGSNKKLPTAAEFKATGVITDYSELALMHIFRQMMAEEATMITQMEGYIDNAGIPLWDEYLKHVRGFGPMMFAICYTQFDMSKAKSPASFHAISGLDVVSDGVARSRRKEHLIEHDYIDRKGKPKTRMGLSFNPVLKTKLLGVLADSFIKQQNDLYYSIYRERKLFLSRHAIYGTHNDGKKIPRIHPVTGEVVQLTGKEGKKEDYTTYVCPAYRDADAKRFMIKIFEVNLYTRWCELLGWDPTPPYYEKLGHIHPYDEERRMREQRPLPTDSPWHKSNSGDDSDDGADFEEAAAGG